MSSIQKFIPPQPLNTAVLFLVFNRPDTTKKVFESIRKAKPPRLYVASDGARDNKEYEKVKEVRESIIDNIDWQCEVKTLFRDENLGCKYAISTAIDWFFDNEEMGIILEDDCLPVQSFFWFCEELLNRYKDDIRVGHIGCNNFQKGIKRGNADYYFSIYSHIWGWASWSNRWEKYDAELNSINNLDFIENLFQDRKTKKYWFKIFKAMKKNSIDAWGYQWTFTTWHNNWLSVHPSVNLVKNIGFGKDATHTKEENEQANVQAYELVLKNHPTSVVPDKDADFFTAKFVFGEKPIVIRIINKIKRILKSKFSIFARL